MESFWLAETLKYLYLLLFSDNHIYYPLNDWILIKKHIYLLLII